MHHAETFETRPELAYSVARAHRGKGFATEAARCAVAFVFDTLGHSKLVAYIRPDNTASQRIALKLGATKNGTYESNGKTSDIWHFTRGAV